MPKFVSILIGLALIIGMIIVTFNSHNAQIEKTRLAQEKERLAIIASYNSGSCRDLLYKGDISKFPEFTQLGMLCRLIINGSPQKYLQELKKLLKKPSNNPAVNHTSLVSKIIKDQTDFLEDGISQYTIREPQIDTSLFTDEIVSKLKVNEQWDAFKSTEARLNTKRKKWQYLRNAIDSKWLLESIVRSFCHNNPPTNPDQLLLFKMLVNRDPNLRWVGINPSAESHGFGLYGKYFFWDVERKIRKHSKSAITKVRYFKNLLHIEYLICIEEVVADTRKCEYYEGGSGNNSVTVNGHKMRTRVTMLRDLKEVIGDEAFTSKGYGCASQEYNLEEGDFLKSSPKEAVLNWIDKTLQLLPKHE